MRPLGGLRLFRPYGVAKTALEVGEACHASDPRSGEGRAGAGCLPRRDDGRLLLSRTAVSELGEQRWRDYQAFATRDLSEHEIV